MESVRLQDIRIHGALEQGVVVLGQHKVILVYPADQAAGIAYATIHGVFHTEVFSGMGLPGVQDLVLRKSKSAGEKYACR